MLTQFAWWEALALIAAITMAVMMLPSVDRFTGSQGHIVQMQIDALKVEVDLILEGK